MSEKSNAGADSLEGFPEALIIQKRISDIYSAHLLQIRAATNDDVARALVNRAFDSVAGMSTPIADSHQKGAA